MPPKGVLTDKDTIMSILIASARLNNGYFTVSAMLPEIIRRGAVRASLTTEEKVQYIGKCIKRTGAFEPAFDSNGKRLKGIWKLKEHAQFK